MLETLKLLLGIPEDDVSRDAVLNWIISATTGRLKLLLGGVDPPEELEYIIIDVSVIRYNRIGSEGFDSHEVEGENIGLSDDDFARYADEIEAYLTGLKDTKIGKVRFL